MAVPDRGHFLGSESSSYDLRTLDVQVLQFYDLLSLAATTSQLAKRPAPEP